MPSDHHQRPGGRRVLEAADLGGSGSGGWARRPPRRPRGSGRELSVGSWLNPVLVGQKARPDATRSVCQDPPAGPSSASVQAAAPVVGDAAGRAGHGLLERAGAPGPRARGPACSRRPRSPRTSPRRARTCASRGGRSRGSARSRAATVRCRSSPRGRRWRSGAGGTTSRRWRRTRGSRSRSAGTVGSMVVWVMGWVLPSGSRAAGRGSGCRPGTEVTVRSPWCLPTTIRHEMSSPSPVPEPTGLVVKNGSKIRSTTPSGMPGPVSATSTSSQSSTRRVVRVSVPCAVHRLRRVVDEVGPHLVELGAEHVDGRQGAVVVLDHGDPVAQLPFEHGDGAVQELVDVDGLVRCAADLRVLLGGADERGDPAGGVLDLVHQRLGLERVREPPDGALQHLRAHARRDHVEPARCRARRRRSSVRAPSRRRCRGRPSTRRGRPRGRRPPAPSGPRRTRACAPGRRPPSPAGG